jgi:hypothetical protein
MCQARRRLQAVSTPPPPPLTLPAPTPTPSPPPPAHAAVGQRVDRGVQGQGRVREVGLGAGDVRLHHQPLAHRRDARGPDTAPHGAAAVGREAAGGRGRRRGSERAPPRSPLGAGRGAPLPPDAHALPCSPAPPPPTPSPPSPPSPSCRPASPTTSATTPTATTSTWRARSRQVRRRCGAARPGGGRRRQAPVSRLAGAA